MLSKVPSWSRMVQWFPRAVFSQRRAWPSMAWMTEPPRSRSTVAGPLTVLILLGYIASLGVQSNPDGVLARITPFVPPLAPMVTQARMLLGHAEPWELPASVAVMLVATYGLVRLAGRAYSRNILRFGGRVTLRGVLRP